MNRKIAFRAWDNVNKVMQYSDIIWGDYDFPALSELNYGDNIYNLSNLMQYTGLKDKNNKEIFEGDVVKWFSCRVEKAIVQFSNGIFQLKIQEPENDDYYMDILYNWTSTIEVVGNIYENPELLDNK